MGAFGRCARRAREREPSGRRTATEGSRRARGGRRERRPQGRSESAARSDADVTGGVERSAERAAGRQAGSVGREPDNRPAPSPGASRRLGMGGRGALPFCALVVAKSVDVVPDENPAASHRNQGEDVETHPRVRHVLHRGEVFDRGGLRF